MNTNSKKNSKKNNEIKKVDSKNKSDKILDNKNEVMNEKKDNFRMPLFLVYYLVFILLEIIFKLLIFGVSSIFSSEMVSILGLTTISAFIFTIITKLFKTKGQFITFSIINILMAFWFCISFVFKKVFNTFFCLSIFKLSDQAFAFTDEVISLTLKNIYGVILIFIPFALCLFLRKYIDFKSKLNLKNILYYIGLFIIVSLITFGTIQYKKSEDNSNYKLFYEIDNNSINIQNMGIITSEYLDIKRLIFGFDEEIILDGGIDNIEKNVEEVVEDPLKYNIVDIDFNNLIANEKNKTILSMHKYFMNDTGTLKNDYTGYFAGKNLVVIMAESLNDIALDPNLTPTLYKMANSSFIFENFYTPVNLSTIGGEFQDLTGLFANLSNLSNYWRRGKNYFPYGLGNVYKKASYNVRAYHDNTYSFQDRNKYLKAVGFDKYKGRGNGLEKVMNFGRWPYSDLEMIKGTYNEWINDDLFMTYYISVSGHMPYSRGNAMVDKNWKYVKDLDLSNDAKGYLAANIELDRAVELLIKKLEENGKLNDTVIAIIPDHYPYNLSLDTINELSDYKRDGVIEINHSSLIIWNNNMEDVHVSKVASQLDFIPTLYNLFGIEYDSRLFIGKDILSDSPGLAFFTDRSWVSDYGKYYAASSKFELKDGMSVDQNYVSNMKTEVSNRINMSKLIIEKDYYRKVLP